MKKTFIKKIPGIIAVIMLMVGLNVSAQVWTGPTGAPYQDNALPPIHTGSTQSKTGGLDLGGDLDTTQNIRADYSVYADVGVFGDWINGAKIASGLEFLVAGDKLCFKNPGASNVAFLNLYGNNDETDFDCISSWADIQGTTTSIVSGLGSGSLNETLRFDGSDWVSNGFMKNDDSTVSIVRPIPTWQNCILTPQGPGETTGFLGTKKAYAQTQAGCDVPIFKALGTLPGNISKGLIVNGQGTTIVDSLVDYGGATFNAGSDDQIRISSGRIYGDIDIMNNIDHKGDTQLGRTNVKSGELFSSWGGDFDWGGPGSFNVSTRSDFEASVYVGKDAQTANVNVTGNINVLRQPDFPSGAAYKKIGEGSSVNTDFPGVTSLGSINGSTFQAAFPDEGSAINNRISSPAGPVTPACSDGSLGSFSPGATESTKDCPDQLYAANSGSPTYAYDWFLGRDTLANGSFVYYPRFVKFEKVTISTNPFSGNVNTATLKVRDGAGSGKVLVSDSDGDATWQDLAGLIPPPPEPPEYYVVRREASRESGNTSRTVSQRISCNTGEMMTGGGAWCTGSASALRKSYPRSDNTYEAECARGAGTSSFTVHVYAMCMGLQ